MKIIIHNQVAPDRRKARGFTLIELLVVIAIIMLVAGIALPTIIHLFGAGADAQAYNLLSAQLAYARSQAIFLGTYVGVHVQVGGRAGMQKDCYSAVVWDDPTDANGYTFSLAENCKPEKIPGNMAFGKLTSTFFSGNSYQGLDDSGLADFTTFTIVFSPQGQVVKYIDDNGASAGNIVFNDPKLFSPSGTPPTGTQLWETPSTPEPGVTAVTIFNYAEMKAVSPTGNARRDYMDNNWGQVLALNIYTGRFFYRY